MPHHKKCLMPHHKKQQGRRNAALLFVISGLELPLAFRLEQHIQVILFFVNDLLAL